MSSPPVETAPTPSSNGTAPRGDGRSIRVLRDADELASVRDAWLRLRRDQVAVDPDFFEAALRADPRIVRPHLVVLEENGTAQAMLVARIESLELAVRAGYRTLYAPQVRALTVVYGGILGDVDEQMFLLLLGSVRRALADGEADVAIFRYLPLDSPFHQIASTTPPAVSRQRGADSEIHWELTLPGSVDDVLALLSGKSRRRTNWQSRKLEKDYEGRLSIRLFTEPSDLDDFFRDVETIAGRTYQRALGVAFGDTPAHRERTRVSMEHGWFRGYVLHLDGQPAAFHHGELYQGRFRLGSPGYDAWFASLSIGTYLLLHLIDDLCKRDDARVLDYGVGDAEYKRRFGTTSWLEGNVFVYATTFRGIRINLTRAVLLAGVRGAKRIADRGGFAKTLKQRWRKSLDSTTGETAKPS